MSQALPKSRSLVDRVVHAIGHDIIANSLPPGTQLPNEAEWCERLGVSRSVLREGLRVLVSKKLIDIKSRSGGRVRDKSTWNLLDPDILLWLGQTDDQETYITELFELRRVIEPAAVALAAGRISPAQLKDLRSAYLEMAKAGEDPKLFLEPDARFHRIILGAVGNSLFRALAETVAGALDITLRLSLAAPKGQQQSLPLHKKVVDSIAKGDSKTAAATMLALVNASERDVSEARALSARKRPARRTKANGKTLI